MSFFRSISSHPRATLLGALVLGVAGASASVRLDLKTGFAELLPDNEPGVVTLRATQQRLSDMSAALGEVTCLVAAVIVLPAALRWRPLGATRSPAPPRSSGRA
jgi:hypothetical protein